MTVVSTDIKIDEIELDWEPRKQVQTIIAEAVNPEMTEFESAFLCGIINKFRPQKVVEVGVAAGATTAILLQCLGNVRSDGFIMHSVDYYENLWSNPKKKTGYVALEANQELSKKMNYTYKLHIGKPACTIEEIGDGIDCLILDTIHVVPGEILDFLTMLPHLNDGAVVILHDVGHNLRDNARDSYATGLLFSAVVAEKYMNRDFTHPYGYPNIGAFVVDERTRRGVINLFLTLMITWNLCTPTDLWEQYRKAVKEHYDEEYLELFDKAIIMNKKMITRPNNNAILPYDKIKRGSRVVLYGADSIGRLMKEQLSAYHYCEIVKWVDNDMLKDGVCPVNKIQKTDYDYVLITVENRKTAFEIYTDLLLAGIDRNQIVWWKEW